VGRSRIIYQLPGRDVEIVAIGPRETIYEEATRQLLRSREQSSIGWIARSIYWYAPIAREPVARLRP
jgi:hypothetical protein